MGLFGKSKPKSPTTIEINGLAQLQRKAKKMGKDAPRIMEQAMDDALDAVHGNVPGYPPPPPLSEYRRTGTLGRSYTGVSEVKGHSVVGKFGTNVVYSPWVVSEDELNDGRGPQARVHEDRWYTLQGVIRDSVTDIVGIFRGWIHKLRKDWK